MIGMIRSDCGARKPSFPASFTWKRNYCDNGIGLGEGMTWGAGGFTSLPTRVSCSFKMAGLITSIGLHTSYAGNGSRRSARSVCSVVRPARGEGSSTFTSLPRAKFLLSSTISIDTRSPGMPKGTKTTLPSGSLPRQSPPYERVVNETSGITSWPGTLPWPPAGCRRLSC